jgi:hypothetical protein
MLNPPAALVVLSQTPVPNRNLGGDDHVLT